MPSLFLGLFAANYMLQDIVLHVHGHYMPVERATERFKRFPIPYLGFNLNAL